MRCAVLCFSFYFCCAFDLDLTSCSSRAQLLKLRPGSRKKKEKIATEAGGRRSVGGGGDAAGTNEACDHVRGRATKGLLAKNVLFFD